jgi:hypothetical protein
VIGLLLILACSAFLAAATAVDIAYTVEGLAKGVAVEGNQLIVWLFGPRPTELDLCLHGAITWIIPFGVSLLGWATGVDWLAWVMAGAMVGYGASHLQAAYEWKKLLKN